MRYLSSLSSAQRLWAVGAVVAAIAIVAAGIVLQRAPEEATVPEVSTEMSIREIAPKLGVTGAEVAHALELSVSVPKRKPLGALGVTQAELESAAKHIVEHTDSTLKYYVFGALVLLAWVFMFRLGRPDGSPVSERKTWYPRAPYVAVLLVAVAVAGFALGKSPNPMEGGVKFFKSLVGFYPSILVKLLIFLFFIGLAVVGNKLVCGWACPFGALQELFYSLPLFRRLKRKKVPFRVANTIRGALFGIMLLLLFGIVGGRKGLVIYHYVNPFNLFSLDFDLISVGAMVVVALLLSFAVYRPFCQFVCPFGFLSWLAERGSLVRVHIDRNKCTECGACDRACPLQAAGDRVDGRMFPADCFSCARCLNVCPYDAISYRSVFQADEPVGEEGDKDPGGED